jgi:hypothetical protein
MKKIIKVYEVEGTDLKARVAKLKGGYSETLWCHQVLEREVERLERKQLKDNRK